MTIWQTIIGIVVGGLLTLTGGYLAHRWQYQRTVNLQRKTIKERTYASLWALRKKLLQAYVSRFEALIFSDYHEYKWGHFGAQELDLQEAGRWMQKSEAYVDRIVGIEADLAECLADVRIAYKRTPEITNLTQHIYYHKTPVIKTPMRGEVTVNTVSDLDTWKEKAVKDLQQLIETEFGRPLEALAVELEKQTEGEGGFRMQEERLRVGEHQTSLQEKFHEEQLLTQRLTLFLLANSILFLGYIGLWNSALQTASLKFVVPGVGIACCIVLIFNAWRVKRELNSLDKKLGIKLPYGKSKIFAVFAGRNIGFWLAGSFLAIWGFSLYAACRL